MNMQISPIQNKFCYNKPVNTNFRAYGEVRYLSASGGETLGNVKHFTTTWLNRDRLPEIMVYFTEKYKNVPKVNTHVFGCANGSEPYSIAMLVHSGSGMEGLKKFTPIKAVDCDAGAIYRAESGIITLEPFEIGDVEKYTNGRFKEYFFSDYDQNKYDIRKWYVEPILRNNVRFSVGDALEEYKKVEPDNSIVFVRNMWPYLNIEDRFKLARGLYSQFDKNCHLIIGSFDIEDLLRGRPVEEFLFDAGFKKTPVQYVYEK